MKNPVMLACAMVAALSLSVMAEQKAPAAAAEAGKAQVKAEKVDREAMMNKRLERIKEKDEALYKQLVELKEKDPEAFKAKMRELAKEQGKAHGEAKGEGKREGKGEGKGKKAAQ